MTSHATDISDPETSTSAAHTRNICIIAHVDHGKTTLADNLLAGSSDIHGKSILSQRQAGLGLRYMDSREDEQDRGITMKASCIALSVEPAAPGGMPSIVNLIDSPGHVDFCGEVSAAARLSDGALLVVDAVEGVCVQTHAVLQQAWDEHVVPVLVLNKIDRLIVELKLSPLEAWHHMKNVVQQVNAIAGHLYARAAAGERDADNLVAEARATAGEAYGVADETRVGELQFAPEKGNVLFASAMHGWAFGLDDFARLISAKLGMREAVLQETLWGEFFFEPKQKKIARTNPDGKLKPMFVQFVLQTLWQVYEAVLIEPDAPKRDKIIATLGLQVPPRDLKHSDPLVQLRAIMGQWLPLGRTVLRTAVLQLPSAAASQAARLAHLCPPLAALAPPEATGAPAGAVAAVEATDGEPNRGGCSVASLQRLRHAIDTCDAAADAPVHVHVAKMVFARGVSGVHPDDAFVGLARVFSGKLATGSGDARSLQMRRIGIDNAVMPPELVQIDGLRLYTLMGRELVPTTLLVAGLQLLARADPSVDVATLPTGEHVIATCGEVHLERCLHDLNNTFAPGLEVVVSPPIVPLHESVAITSAGRGEAATTNKLASLIVRVLRLPAKVRACVDEHKAALRTALLTAGSWLSLASAPGTDGDVREALLALRKQLEGELAASSGPLCEEPMDDVAFVLDELRAPTAAEAAAAELQSGELEGQLIVAAKDACRAAVLAGSPRVLEPVYLCELQTSQDSMGKAYGVLSKRRAAILSEELKEGTPIFTIRAHLPVAESFGFATDLRKSTSGAAHPQLVFSHFEALHQDPNFVVTSEEDQEALDDGDLPTINLARKLVDDVRRRKGLRVEEKVVQSATKQRTRTKMK
ncbi:elongation factor tu gtp-binding domain-containing protein 1 isoform 1 [Chrysochromulina tobinii]|uniref:Elongation factor-like 1 n=1 Tax=Chrysochromulina tobinii TaxID=1460289 RepID=A0A0M0J5N1_9EUKA|nr:elongation factor tu gtp-binding domain-containing protein 1 isoform 1 [Chrysochromulina tobinii]|eukprot:KOO21503.1 elongation factor tu gtp-binding domain-containing protein 1 isoform 1 [Chrysochromulina sp. CCMP291]